jgi:hypothetical protein
MVVICAYNKIARDLGCLVRTKVKVVLKKDARKPGVIRYL